MIGNIKIDIDQDKDCFRLSGETEKLLSKRRAKVYLKDYLSANLLDADNILVPFEPEDRDQVLNDIQKLLRKFGFQEKNTQSVEKVLGRYLQEEKNFEVFSRQAYSIRNNELDETHRKNFEDFTKSLVVNLPNRRLYPLQLLSSYHLTFSQNACNFSVPGSGKTSIVYGSYSYLSKLYKDNPKFVDKLMIIGPLSSFGPWEIEYEECFGKTPFSKRLSGGVGKDERISHFYSSDPAELSLISYNGVSNMIEDIVYFLKKYNVMVVLDEAHKIKNIEGGIIASSVLSLAKYCSSRVILTGTPAPNGYEDIYNLFKFIWPMRNIISYHPFQLKYMSSDQYDLRIPRLIDEVSPYFIRIRKRDLMIPEPIEHDPIIVEMGKVQKEIYHYIERSYMDYFISFEDRSNLQDIFARARLIRLMQTSTNPALLQRPIDEFFREQGITNDTFIDDSAIMEKILSYYDLETPNKFIVAGEKVRIIIEANEKVIVWSVFIQNILDFQEYLSSIGIKAKVLYGATPVEQNEPDENIETRESIVREFHSEDCSYSVIIANPFAVAESISLHKACHNAIYLERSFNAAHFLQSKDRIHRYGLKEEDEINYYYILSDNNTDHTIHQRLETKVARMMQIIENEPIPLFKRITDDTEGADDIKALIDNYVNKSIEKQ
jgi:SNF2 family DNA or RNA helicase